MKAFPIPVVSFGPDAPADDEALDYLPLPKDMDTYHPPVLPEPEALQAHAGAKAVLHAALAALEAIVQEVGAPHSTRVVSLNDLSPEDRQVINQVLGEGEASARIAPDATGIEVAIQESLFAGVWRVVTTQGGVGLDDRIEVGAVPQVLREVARADILPSPPHWTGALPPGVQNAPLLVDEVRDHSRRWQPGQVPQVINLSLLPVTPEDIAYLDHLLGTGRITVLSRGYGNCRITNTRLSNCWRVIYYNGMDTVILNSVEVVDVPEVALAAPEDLQDSRDRLADVLNWLEDAA